MFGGHRFGVIVQYDWFNVKSIWYMKLEVCDVAPS